MKNNYTSSCVMFITPYMFNGNINIQRLFELIKNCDQPNEMPATFNFHGVKIRIWYYFSEHLNYPAAFKEAKKYWNLDVRLYYHSFATFYELCNIDSKAPSSDSEALQPNETTQTSFDQFPPASHLPPLL